jgi:leucine dehydrogenase
MWRVPGTIGAMDCALAADAHRLVLAQDRDSGLRCAIALDDLTLGPGFGGVRWTSYSSDFAAAVEARRLAEAMTAKHALAGLPYGGAKSVICAPEAAESDRSAVLAAFAAVVQELDGRYLPGVDIGTTTQDMARLAAEGLEVTCAGPDPSPSTAAGVLAAIAAAVEHRLDRDLTGVVVAVQGAGHVGGALAVLLSERGAHVLVADVDADRAAQVAARADGRVVDPADVCTAACDVVAPCASARVLDAAVVEALRCTVVAGAANDVLAEPEVAARLAARDIAFVPDAVASAGGVIFEHAGRAGWDAAELESGLAGIGRRTAEVLRRAGAEGRTTTAVAADLVGEALTAGQAA